MFINRLISRLIQCVLLLAALTIGNCAIAQMALHLSVGWNLQGNSGKTFIDVATTFGDSTKIRSVWKWNKIAHKWSFFSPSMTSSELMDYATTNDYEILTNIEQEEGYWVHALESVALPVPLADDKVTLIESDLQLGWNLVSNSANKTPSQLNQDLKSSLSAAGKAIISAWAWDASMQKWRFFSPELESQGSTALEDYIAKKNYLPFSSEPSVTDGYWLNIKAINNIPPVIDETPKPECQTPKNVLKENVSISWHVGMGTPDNTIWINCPDRNIGGWGCFKQAELIIPMTNSSLVSKITMFNGSRWNTITEISAYVINGAQEKLIWSGNPGIGDTAITLTSPVQAEKFKLVLNNSIFRSDLKITGVFGSPLSCSTNSAIETELANIPPEAPSDAVSPVPTPDPTTVFSSSTFSANIPIEKSWISELAFRSTTTGSGRFKTTKLSSYDSEKVNIIDIGNSNIKFINVRVSANVQPEVKYQNGRSSFARTTISYFSDIYLSSDGVNWETISSGISIGNGTYDIYSNLQNKVFRYIKIRNYSINANRAIGYPLSGFIYSSVKYRVTASIAEYDAASILNSDKINTFARKIVEPMIKKGINDADNAANFSGFNVFNLSLSANNNSIQIEPTVHYDNGWLSANIKAGFTGELVVGGSDKLGLYVRSVSVSIDNFHSIFFWLDWLIGPILSTFVDSFANVFEGTTYWQDNTKTYLPPWVSIPGLDSTIKKEISGAIIGENDIAVIIDRFLNEEISKNNIKQSYDLIPIDIPQLNIHDKVSAEISLKDFRIIQSTISQNGIVKLGGNVQFSFTGFGENIGIGSVGLDTSFELRYSDLGNGNAIWGKCSGIDSFRLNGKDITNLTLADFGVKDIVTSGIVVVKASEVRVGKQVLDAFNNYFTNNVGGIKIFGT